MTKAIVVRVEGDYVITAEGAGLLSAFAGQATAARDEATAARDEATAARDEATAARDEATTARDEATAARDEATAARDEATAARDEATAARDEATAARDEATAARDEATAARDEATTARDEATAARDEATTAAAAALAAAGVGEYPDTGAGLSGTTEGETFWVDMGDGTGQVYLHDPGPTATPLQKFIIDPTDSGAADIFAGGVPTTAALVSTDSDKGAALVKVENGSTVQQVVNRQPLQVDAYYEDADGDDWAPAFERAAVAARVDRRGIACTPGATYRFLTSCEIWPVSSGWVPPIEGNRAILILGAESPSIGNEYAGFRYRGIKSGALANPIKPAIRDLTIDAQNIAISNGVCAIFMENASEWEFVRVHGINYKLGYHISHWRYADGGALTGKPGIVKECRVSGYVMPTISEIPWYPYHESGDLATAVAGQSVAAGATEAIPCVNGTMTGLNAPLIATVTLFKNETAGPLVVPSSYLLADIVSAGFTEIGSTAPLPSDGSTQAAVIYMYYSTGGQKCAAPVIPGVDNIVQDCDFTGGRYSAYVQGAVGPRFKNVEARYGTRGIVAEWSVTGLRVDDCNIQETLSSGVLTGFGSSGWKVNNTLVECLTSRWIGEGLFNFQLGCGNGFGRGNRTNTHNNVTSGQTHVHIATNSSDIDFECDMRGDCKQGYVVIESAAAPSLEATIPELHKGGIPGGASQDMANIRISGSITPISSKAAAAGATMVAILQVPDPVYGEIGLSRVDLSGLSAGRSKIPIRYLKIYENDGLTSGSPDAAKRAKQVNNCLLENVEFPVETSATTAAIRMVLPRKWAHFRRVTNVTNMDDGIERIVSNVATPDLTFGKYWWDTGSTVMSGIVGGQGASSSEGYDGREIIVRGNNSRAWTTISSVSGTRDSLRITGSPITPQATQRLRLTYSKTVVGWIGGLT